MLIRNLNQLLHLPSPLPYLLSCTDKPPAGPPRFILSLLVNKILRYDDLRSRCCWLTKFPSLRVRSSRRDINWINQLIQQWARVGVICVSTDSSAETLHYNASTLHAENKTSRAVRNEYSATLSPAVGAQFRNGGFIPSASHSAAKCPSVCWRSCYDETNGTMSTTKKQRHNSEAP